MCFLGSLILCYRILYGTYFLKIFKLCYRCIYLSNATLTAFFLMPLLGTQFNFSSTSLCYVRELIPHFQENYCQLLGIKFVFENSWGLIFISIYNVTTRLLPLCPTSKCSYRQCRARPCPPPGYGQTRGCTPGELRRGSLSVCGQALTMRLQVRNLIIPSELLFDMFQFCVRREGQDNV